MTPPALIPHNRIASPPGASRAVARVLRSGQIGQGPEVAALESQIETLWGGGRVAVCVQSGTVALALALRALEAQSVALPTYACSALLYAAEIALGGKARVMLHDFATEPDPRASARVVVPLWGVPSQSGEVTNQITDTTHCPGSADGIEVFSMGPTKLFSTPGGGCVLAPEDIAATVRDLRDYDCKPYREGRGPWQMSDVHAAFARARLRSLDAEISRRQLIAGRYFDKRGPFSVSYCYRHVLHTRQPQYDLIHEYARRGIQAIIPITRDELLHRQLGLNPARYPCAEEEAATTISVPCYPSLTDAEIARVASAVEEL